MTLFCWCAIIKIYHYVSSRIPLPSSAGASAGALTIFSRPLAEWTMDSASSGAKMISRQIDRNLRRQKEEEVKVIKVLLLGPGDSGKSTILKQIKFLHNNGKCAR